LTKHLIFAATNAGFPNPHLTPPPTLGVSWAANARNGGESEGLNSTTVQIISRGRLGLPQHARSNIHVERVLAHVERPVEMPAKVEALAL
jgi:hypothetical protein